MIASSDLRLRAAEPEDLELAYALENDTALWPYGSATTPFSRFALKQFLESATGDIYTDKQVRLTIERRQADDVWTPVGFADLFNFDPRHHRAEIGLALLPAWRGQNIGEQAVRLLMDYAVIIDLHMLYAIIGVDNGKASRTFERLGFQASAQLCDWLWNGDSYVEARVWQAVICRDRDRLRVSRP